jgi:flavin reductase (DIM6/NTAB) family NADH-FMN oxidoreductase RutF
VRALSSSLCNPQRVSRLARLLLLLSLCGCLDRPPARLRPYTPQPNGTDAVGNLAPYSYFAAVAHDPPHVAIGCCAAADGRPGGHKDTLANILETKEFVVNIVSEWYAEAANHCCGAFPPAADERALAGLGALPSARVRPPRVAEAAVHLECRLAHAYAVRGAGGGVSTTVVIGEVLAVHVAEGAAGASPSGKLVVDLEKLRPLARCGGNTYARVGGLFDLPRPDRAAG